MTLEMLVPLVHIVGVLLLFVSLGVEWVAIGALSRSPTLRRAERWATSTEEVYDGRLQPRPSSSPPALRWQRGSNCFSSRG